MNLTALHYFVEIVKLGSLNKAAHSLYLTPSTLMASLNALENELGYKLVTRTKRGVRPTKEGELFYSDAMVVLQMQERWRALPVIGAYSNAPVYVSAIPAIYDTFLHELIFHMAEKHPQIPVQANSVTVLNLDQDLINGDIRIAFRAYTPGEEQNLKTFASNLNLEISFLGHDHYHVFCNPDHPLASREEVHMAELKKLDGVCVAFPAAYKFDFMRAFNPEKTIYLYNQLDVLYMIANKPRFGVLPSIYAHSVSCTNSGLINIPILDVDLPISYAFLYPAASSITTQETLFVELVHDYFKDKRFDKSRSVKRLI